MLDQEKIEVVGLGSPIIDQIFYVSDEFLQTVPGEKGGSQSVDHSTLREIRKRCSEKAPPTPGGSAANTILSQNRLGRKVGMIGMIGKDKLGKRYTKSLQNHGVKTFFVTSEQSCTGHSACLTTPDGQRTMRTYLGASCEMRSHHLKREFFQGARLLHCEGYTIYNGDGELTEAAMKMAKEEQSLVSIDLASFELVKRYKNLIIDLLKNYVDIVFANQDEALSIFPGEVEDACDFLAGLCKVAVVMLGSKGCYVQSGSQRILCPTTKLPCVDSTGAGDSFAAGFLHQYLDGASLIDCCHVGHLLGGQVIQQIGAQIPDHKWDALKLKIAQLQKMSQLLREPGKEETEKKRCATEEDLEEEMGRKKARVSHQPLLQFS